MRAAKARGSEAETEERHGGKRVLYVCSVMSWLEQLQL